MKPLGSFQQRVRQLVESGWNDARIIAHMQPKPAYDTRKSLRIAKERIAKERLAIPEGGRCARLSYRHNGIPFYELCDGHFASAESARAIGWRVVG